ncbi:unnamed protein product, partial [Cylicostephanus goldi]
MDEMVCFITQKEGEEEAFVERTFIRDMTGRPVKIQSGHKFTNDILSARRSRARLLQSEPYASVLQHAKSYLNESRELFDNVFSTGSSHQSQNWWNAVTSNRTRRKPKRPNTTKLSPLMKLPTHDSCDSYETRSHEVSEDAAAEMDLLSLKEKLAVRLHHMNLQVSEQIQFEEHLLRIFERFYESYNPKEYLKTLLDMERDFEEGDSEAVVQQKRIERLRYVLMLPPGKLAPEKKPDFGDHCGTVINSPDEVDMNKHML